MKILLEELAKQVKFKPMFNDCQRVKKHKKAGGVRMLAPETAIKKKNSGGIEESSLMTVITCHLLDVSFSDPMTVFSSLALCLQF